MKLLRDQIKQLERSLTQLDKRYKHVEYELEKRFQRVTFLFYNNLKEKTGPRWKIQQVTAYHIHLDQILAEAKLPDRIKNLLREIKEKVDGEKN